MREKVREKFVDRPHFFNRYVFFVQEAYQRNKLNIFHVASHGTKKLAIENILNYSFCYVVADIWGCIDINRSYLSDTSSGSCRG